MVNLSYMQNMFYQLFERNQNEYSSLKGGNQQIIPKMDKLRKNKRYYLERGKYL